MSFTLQIFRAPGLQSVEEAARAVDQDRPATPDDAQRYVKFVIEILRAYPNDEEGDGEESAWPEGLYATDGGRWVHVIAVNLDVLDENFMAHVGHAAANAGLCVLDPQNGLFYREDRHVARLWGKTKPLPEPTPVKPPPAKKRLPDALTSDAVRDRLTQEFCRRMAVQGFKRDPKSGLAVRMMGQVEQGVDIGVLKDPDSLTLYNQIRLRCPAIARIWHEALGDSVADYVKRMAALPHGHPDMQVHISELRVPPGEEARALGRSSFTHAKDWAGCDAWLTRLVAWFEAEGLEDLARMKDPAGLAAYLLNEQQLQDLRYRNDLLPNELFHRLVLIGAFAPGRKAEWLEAFWQHFGRSGLRFDPTAHHDFPHFKQVAGSLIAYLDTPQFAREAEKLRARN